MATKSSKLTQKDYLKKYLSGGGDGKKKKKKDKSAVISSSSKSKIIDDDVDVSQLRPLDATELDDCDPTEDAPQVAGIIDERPAEIRAKEQYVTQKWKVLTDPHMGDVQGVIETVKDNDQNELPRKRDRSPDEAELLAREAKRLEEIREQELEKQHDKEKHHRKHKKHKSKQTSSGKDPMMDEDVLYDKTVLKKEMDRERAEILAKEEKQRKHLEKYQKWGKGVKQLEDKKEQLLEQQHEMEKPLARYADDADLDKHLKDRLREEDPMFEYIKSKKVKDKKSQPDKPIYQGSWPPNRYNIPPGHRWDGVDRSTGYEKKWFETQNARKALEEEAFKWGTEDL